MNDGARLGLYAGGLVVAFAAAFGLASVLVPGTVVAGWNGEDGMESHDTPAEPPADSLKGLSLSANGYVLSPISAPTTPGRAGELAFSVTDTAGTPVTEYTEEHEKDLHLIVVRADGTQFGHVHPTLSDAGVWSLPWEWDAAGTYRIYADFTPGAEGAEGLTLTQLFQVAGEYAPLAPEPSRTDEVDGFVVSVSGDLTAGTASELTLSVTRDDEPVTTLEPYLGAFGHLVALREGDLAYLHVHAEGDEPQAGETAGPDIVFVAETPTAGRYLLYLDFQVDGEVHTAQFVLDATHGPEDAMSSAPDSDTSEDTESHGH